jgi:hypothetical protein
MVLKIFATFSILAISFGFIANVAEVNVSDRKTRDFFWAVFFVLAAASVGSLIGVVWAFSL